MAKGVVQQNLVLPNSIVTHVLPFVAESIRRAHALAPAKWGVTPRNNGLRLNLGFVEVLTMDVDSSGVLVEAASTPNGVILEAGYATVPGSGRVVVPASKATRWLPLLRETHDSALARAGETPFNSGAKQGHRDWIVDEIARLTGIHLPLPMHDGSEGALVNDASEVARDADYSEGSVARVLVNRYERDPAARAACLAHYGPACFVCGMTFAKFYGSEMEGVIHVHHLEPIHAAEGEREVDPIRDLRPLCPNCHTAVHQTNPPRKMEEMIALVAARLRS